MGRFRWFSKGWPLAAAALAALVLAAFYVLLVRHWVQAYFVQAAPTWFVQWVETLYPRLAVERHRFSPDFFLQKADQVVLRLVLVLLCGAVWGIAWDFFPTIKKKWREWWKIEWGKSSKLIVWRFFYVATLGFTWPWLGLLQNMPAYSDFYRPVLLLKWLGLPVLPPVLAGVLFAVYVLAIGGCVLWPRRMAWAAVPVCVLFLLFLGYLQSFEKTDHGFATWGYAAMLLCWVGSTGRTWPFLLVQAAVAAAYFFAGLEKVLIGGWYWASAANFKAYLQLQGTAWGLAVAKHDFACALLPWLAIAFELGFPLVLLWPRLRYVWLPVGLCFHWGTFLLLGAGGWLSPWWALYIFFLPKPMSKQPKITFDQYPS